MRNILIIIISFITYTIYSQEVLDVRFGEYNINFNDTSEYKYVKIDTNNIWFITKPNKQILYLDDYAIISDTNDYYPFKVKSSFQFKLHLEYCCDLFHFSFRHKYDFEKNKDGGIIETSYDNGLSWQNILYDSILNKSIWYTRNLYILDDSIESIDNQPGFTGLQSGLTYVEINFWSGMYYTLEIDTMLLRYTIVSDSINANNEGWMLYDFIFGLYMVGVDEKRINHSIYIFPNPSSNIIYISSLTEIIQKLEIFSLSGKKLIEKTNTNSINITSINSGTYLLRINNKYLEKFIIK